MSHHYQEILAIDKELEVAGIMRECVSSTRKVYRVTLDGVVREFAVSAKFGRALFSESFLSYGVPDDWRLLIQVYCLLFPVAFPAISGLLVPFDCLDSFESVASVLLAFQMILDRFPRTEATILSDLISCMEGDSFDLWADGPRAYSYEVSEGMRYVRLSVSSEAKIALVKQLKNAAVHEVQDQTPDTSIPPPADEAFGFISQDNDPTEVGAPIEPESFDEEVAFVEGLSPREELFFEPEPYFKTGGVVPALVQAKAASSPVILQEDQCFEVLSGRRLRHGSCNTCRILHTDRRGSVMPLRHVELVPFDGEKGCHRVSRLWVPSCTLLDHLYFTGKCTFCKRHIGNQELRVPDPSAPLGAIKLGCKPIVAKNDPG